MGRRRVSPSLRGIGRYEKKSEQTNSTERPNVFALETGEEFLPVRRPARNRSPHHSNPSSPLPPAESDHVTQPKTPTVTTATTTTTTTSPISNRLRRIFSRNLFRKSRSDDVPTPTLPNKELPPPPEVDRGLKPRPPTYRHLKPASPPTFSVSAPLQETNIFTFPSTTTTTTTPAMMTSSTTMTSSAVATAPSASSDSAIDSLTQKSSDEHLSPLAWFPTKRTLATTTEDVATTAQKPGSSSSAAGVGSSGSDSGAESEELDEPFMTAESRTYHYSVDEGEEEEEEEENDARGKNTGELPHRAYFASSSYTGVRPSQGDENAVETEV